MEQWKWKAIDKLKDFEAQKAAVENIPDEIATLVSEARSIKSGTSDGVTVHGGGSSQDDRLLSNIVRRQELGEALKRAKLAVRQVERGLSVLDPEERRALDLMYIHREKGAQSRLASEFQLDDDRSVYKRVEKALRHFTIALYGITEG